MHDPMEILGFLYWALVIYANLTNCWLQPPGQNFSYVKCVHEKSQECYVNLTKIDCI